MRSQIVRGAVFLRGLRPEAYYILAIRNGARRCRSPLDTGVPARARNTFHSITPLRFVTNGRPRPSLDRLGPSAGIDLDALLPSHRRRLNPSLRPRPRRHQPAAVLLFPHPMQCIFPTAWSGPPGPSRRAPALATIPFFTLVSRHRPPGHRCLDAQCRCCSRHYSDTTLYISRHMPRDKSRLCPFPSSGRSQLPCSFRSSADPAWNR